jgi:hypothetical protein
MLKAIFYARFHPERGPSVVHQYPKASIITKTDQASLLDFSSISSYVIPAYELCDRPLAVCTDGLRILGFPVSLEDEKYERNRFTYNVCFVIEEAADPKLWDRVVSKTAAFFTDLEIAEGLLQAEERLDGLNWAGDEHYPAEDIGIVFPLLESIFAELNAYEETCVRVTSSQVLNLRLTAPPRVASSVVAWNVPLLIRSLPAADEWTCDLALLQIQPHIDGVNHIAKIAELADVEVKLVVKTVRELLFHKRVTLLDIFHFHGIYALTADFAWFARDDPMQDECSRYIAKQTSNNDDSLTSGKTLVALYRDLNPGTSVKDFYLSHEAQLLHIDIRRFITFGVLKGFLRRLHKYALSVESNSIPARKSLSNGSSTKEEQSLAIAAERDRAWRKAAFSSGWATPPTEADADTREGNTARNRIALAVDDENAADDFEQVRQYLDGQHCFDEICVALRLSERQFLERIRGHSEVVLFNK